MSVKDSLLGLLIVCIWGFNFVVIAWGVSDMPPLLMGALRSICVALLGSLFIQRPTIPWRWLAAYALTLTFGQFALMFSAMAFGMPAGLASIVLQAQAVFTLLLSVLFLHEKITAKQLVAMLLAGGGLAVIGLSAGSADTADTHMTLLGFALCLAAAFSWAGGNIINRMINQRGYRANVGLVVWSSWLAFIPFMLTSLYFEGSELIITSLAQFSWRSLLVILYLACFASILGYSLWSYLLQHYPVGQVAPLTLGIPVVGLLSAALFLDETLNAMQVMGILLVMFGLVTNSVTGRFSLARLWQRKASRVSHRQHN